MDQLSFPVHGVIAKNSIDFVRQLFQLYQQNLTAVLLRDINDDERKAGLKVENIIDPISDTGWAELKFTPQHTDQIAQISFTSGTEGKPKGILISHKNLSDMVDRLNLVMHMDASIREYIGVPVYHSFGFGRCRAVATVGGKFFIPANGFNPLEIKSMLESRQINAISAVPSLWRILFECADMFGDETREVKWIEIGSQYMSAEEKLKIKKIFPAATIVQHYGLTEASRATFLSIHETDDPLILESVGSVVGDTEIRCNAEGKIAIRGSVVAQQRFIAGQFQPLTDQEGWLTTGDLGDVREGLVYYLGRADDIINCGGVKIVPDNVERELRSALGLETGIACARVKDDMRGEGILIAYESATNLDTRILKTAAESVLAGMKVTVGNALHFMAVDTIPVTATGKVQRKELGAQFEKSRPFTQATDEPPKLAEHQLSTREHELVALWQQLLKIEHIDIHESFLDLGGDSLTAITAIVKMKRMGVPDHICRGILQGKSIAQLAADERAEQGSANASVTVETPLQEHYKNTLNIKVVRGVLVLLVIFAHWSEGFLERMPDWAQSLKPFLAPFLAFGTPGFAVMYGVTMGYSFYPLFLRTPQRLMSLTKPIFLVLAAGVLLLGSVHIGMKFLEYGSITYTQFAVSFYNVLTFYLLATLSLYWWFSLLKRSGSPVITALLIAVFSHLLYLAYTEPLTRIPMEGFAEFGKLLIAAKYSYFNMACGVFVGLAIGIGLTQREAFNLGKKPAMIFALTCLAISVVYSQAAHQLDMWAVWPTRMVEGWRWFFYVGACLLMLVGCHRILNHYHCMNKPGRFLLELLASVGLLAFPLFILHELVLPAKDAMVHAGLPNSMGLMIAMSLFIIITAYLLKVSQKLQF